MTPFPVTPKIANHIFEGATGASGRMLDQNGGIFVFADVDWGEMDFWDAADDVMMKVGIYGDYELSDLATGEVITSSFAQDVLIDKILIGCTIRIDDPVELRSFLGVKPRDQIAITDLALLAQTAMPLKDCGLESLSIVSLSIDGSDLTFEVQADLSSIKAMIGVSRVAYSESWGDQGWIPRNPQEALFELCLGSNPNPSPDEIGFAFTEFHESRAQMSIRKTAESLIESHPELEMREDVSFSDWIEVLMSQDEKIISSLDDHAIRTIYTVAKNSKPVPSFHPQI